MAHLCTSNDVSKDEELQFPERPPPPASPTAARNSPVPSAERAWTEHGTYDALRLGADCVAYLWPSHAILTAPRVGGGPWMLHSAASTNIFAAYTLEKSEALPGPPPLAATSVGFVMVTTRTRIFRCAILR